MPAPVSRLLSSSAKSRAMLPLLLTVIWSLLPQGAAATPAKSATLDVAGQLAAARRDLDAQRPVEAAHTWLQIALASDDEALVADLARGCQDNHQLSAALTIAEHWLNLNPTSEQARLTAAQAAIKLFKPDVALVHFKSLLESAYITPAAGFMTLSSELDDEDSMASLLTFSQLAQTYPEVAEAHYVVARLAAQTEDLALMQRSAQRAHELSPYWSPAGLLLARAQLAQGQTDAALTTAQAVIKRDNSVATRSEYANILLLSNRASEAVTLWRELEAQPQGDVSPALRALAQLDFQVGNYQSAFNRFNKLLNTGRDVSESIFFLGGIAERTGANDEARQLYDRVQDGDYASAAQLRVAQLIQQSDGLPAALTFLQSYGNTNPTAALLTYQARATMLNQAGDETAALKLLDEAVTNYPQVASVRMSQAFQLLRLNKVNAGIQSMQTLLRMRPGDPVVLNSLGYTLVDNDKDVRLGHDYLVAALKLAPDSGAVLDSMGWALFKLGQREQALEYLERAATRTVDADVDLHRGEVLWSLGRKQEALQVWQASSSRFPDNAKLLERMKRAQAGS